MKTLSITKLRLIVITMFITIFVLNLSLQSCSMGRYRTTHGKQHVVPMHNVPITNTLIDKSW